MRGAQYIVDKYMLSKWEGKEVISKLYVSDTMHWEDITKSEVWDKTKGTRQYFGSIRGHKVLGRYAWAWIYINQLRVLLHTTLLHY